MSAEQKVCVSLRLIMHFNKIDVGFMKIINIVLCGLGGQGIGDVRPADQEEVGHHGRGGDEDDQACDQRTQPGSSALGFVHRRPVRKGDPGQIIPSSRHSPQGFGRRIWYCLGDFPRPFWLREERRWRMRPCAAPG